MCTANPQTRVTSLFQGWVWPQGEGKRMSLIQDDVDQERKSVGGQNLNSVRVERKLLVTLRRKP